MDTHSLPPIFCVEDDHGIRELITCALRAGGYEVEDFPAAEPFYARLTQKRPALVLLDIMLPDEDGITILQKLKSDESTASIPVIMLSAKSAEVDKVMGLENGADDYITKPFGIMEMLSRIKAVLRRCGGASLPSENPNRLTVGKLTLDLSQRTASCGNEVLSLTYKEYELLAYLMRHRGAAVSRETLLDEVWGFSYEGETRTVDAHIKTLRQKLDSAGCPGLIETVRGYGYKI